MLIITKGNVPRDLHTDLKLHFKDYYARKIRRCCDEDCPEDCDGKHNYELPETYPPLFKEI